MLTKLVIYICIHISNHYVVYLRLIQCYMSILSQFLKELKKKKPISVIPEILSLGSDYCFISLFIHSLSQRLCHLSTQIFNWCLVSAYYVSSTFPSTEDIVVNGKCMVSALQSLWSHGENRPRTNRNCQVWIYHKKRKSGNYRSASWKSFTRHRSRAAWVGGSGQSLSLLPLHFCKKKSKSHSQYKGRVHFRQRKKLLERLCIRKKCGWFREL